MKVYHGNYTEKELLGEVNTQEEADQLMKAYLDRINFKSYYYRIMFIPDVKAIQLDYGSWTKFFWIEELEGAECYGISMHQWEQGV